MYQGKVGFRIFNTDRYPDKKKVEELSKYPTPNIADAMGRFRVMDPGMKCVTKGKVIAGPALTVMARPGDNLMPHKAIEIAKPGDVIVINTCGNTNSAVWGELMTYAATKQGIAGLVVDGAVRDSKEINEIGFPVFARNVVASGCDKDGPGEINCAISCGGVVVNPGDIVIASEEGIVVVPLDDAEEVLNATIAVHNRESARIKEIEEGKVIKDDINTILRSKGVI
ncbi:MAG TPA: RraA family protein [Patescibacteria group bacterium]|nr:RraA family protein [Patescibacteria group bacterium]